MSARRARRKQRKPNPARRLTIVAVVIAVAAAVVFAFLQYQRALERPDPLSDRLARTAPDRLALKDVALYHPDPGGHGLVWSRVSVPVSTVTPAMVGRRVVSAWASRVAEVCGDATEHDPVAHFFLDDRQIAYVDFEPEFFSQCSVGTTGELELLRGLEETVLANLPNVTAVVLLAGGVPVESPWGHIRLEAGRVIP